MRRILPPEHGVYLGVSNFRLVEKTGAVAGWTAANGPHPRIVNWFQQWLTGERRSARTGPAACSAPGPSR